MYLSRGVKILALALVLRGGGSRDSMANRSRLNVLDVNVRYKTKLGKKLYQTIKSIQKL